ncbi:MAG TPA: DNA polymerase III subunit [Candidatus Pacearchaeota archaeon]|nr:DNA polymerase III subunit [Candidatus Pacearchaeota archaeon]HPR80255.1 DNA polymerase III subunit [Candidatus Pacearchaeota archaeon]
MTIGHKKQKEVLERLAKGKNIPHALLFSGIEKIGKKKVAIEFIKSIFCEKEKGFCGECYSCRSIDSASFPDLSIIEAKDRNIEIEEVRDLQNRLSLKSYNNSLKVGIIDDAHLMRKDAQNALLKVLEEPKGDTLLILITSYPQMLLPTVRSRLEEIKFSVIPRKEIEDYLVSLGADIEKTKEIALISSGQVGKAIEFLNDEDKLKFFNKAIKDIISLAHSEMYKRFDFAKEFKENQDEIVNVLDIWERFMRREILLKVYGNKGSLENYSLKRIKEIIDELEKTKYLIENTNVNKKLALENLLITL